MLMFFRPLKVLVKLDAVWIDNNVFRMHYKATVIILITASLVVTSRQYIGDPIDCIVEGIPLPIMDTYCWIHSTFSLPTRWRDGGKKFDGYKQLHPGISPMADASSPSEAKYHKYYQWVLFVLYLQAMFFYVPRFFWKKNEGGKIKLLCQKLLEPLIKKEEKEVQLDNIVKYWRLHRGTHTSYAVKFFLAEIMNFANIIGQIYFTDFFLNYEFRRYGMEVFGYTGLEHEDRPDPMVTVFPKVTKCTFYKYGPSGTVELKDGICVLPLNIINEKIYLMLWVWFIFLAILTGVFLVYRFMTIIAPQIRVTMITVKGGKSMSRMEVETILDANSLSFAQKVGDWLVLFFITKNLDTLTNNELIKRLYKECHVEKMPEAKSLITQV